MVLRKYSEVFDSAYQLYKQGLFQQSYDLLTDALAELPGQRRRFFEWRISLAARMGKLQLAEENLRSALDEGYFYNEFTLRKDPDLKELQGRLEFEALAVRNFEMLAEAQKIAEPVLHLLEPVETRFEEVPLLMALHGNNSTFEQFHWHHLAEKGWLVALPQSSQVGGNGIYVWNDQRIAKKELVDHYSFLAQKISVNPAKSILAGFSMGGYTAINAAFNQYFPISGFLAVAPYIDDPQTLVRALAGNTASKLRGYFLLGQEDEVCTPAAIKTHELLNQRGIPCGMELFPGVAHDFPENYRAAIDRAIQFILQE